MRPASRCTAKASLVGAFFVCAAWLAPAAPAGADCHPDRSDEMVRVRQVYDGDSLVLADGRRVRLIGVNTPELGRDGAPHQPLALRARDRLRQLVFASAQRVRLRYGPERKDRHGRTLAHLFLADGGNAAARLLEEGLGWAIAIPPNLWGQACYQRAERRARQARRGVWSQPAYRPAEAGRLALGRHGFGLVTGRVVQVSDRAGKRRVRLGRLVAEIPLADLKYFPDPPGPAWIGRRLEVRGWLRPVRGELRVTLHHPAMLRRLDPKTGTDGPQQ